MGRRHLTPQEIIAQCKTVARESRMADRTPWSAMSIMCSYVIMKSEGFKGQRIFNITSCINELETKWISGELDLKEFSNKLMEKADWTIEHQRYEESDIKAKKGSYQYWIDKKQISPQNTINEQATRYMLFFFNVLIDNYGFGKERLTRVKDYINDLLEEYRHDRTSVQNWKKSLFEEAGVVMEMPVDPLTQTVGSVMT